MQLLKIEIPKEKLDYISPKEVMLFVQIGSLMSDLSMLLYPPEKNPTLIS